MTDAKLAVILAAKDQTERTLKSFQSRFVGMTKIVGAAGVAMGAALASAVNDGVKSFADLERRMKRTESIIKATGNAANLSTGQMLDLAERLDLATLNDRDAILDAINAMQTFKSVSGDTFKRSIELAVDLAEVMGSDLRSQTVQLGKALEDPVKGLTALRRVGVSFTEAQKEQIKTLVESNRTLEAQSLILDAIEGQVGGAAEGAAGGLSGKMDTLSFRWREFKETLAESTGAIEKTAGALTFLSSALQGLSEHFNPSVSTKMAEQIERIERAFAKNPNWSGPVADQMRNQLETLRRELFRLNELREFNFAPVSAGGGSPVAAGIASIATPTPVGNPYMAYRTELGTVGAERGHMASAAAAAASADFSKQARAEYDGLMVGATDSFMGMAAANERAMEMMKDNTASAADFMKDAFTGWGVSFSNQLADMIWEGEFSFDKLLESFGRMLTQMVIQRGATSLFNTIGASLFHSGGLVGTDGGSRSVPAGLFAFAPRLHNGLAPDEFPAILQRGERVIPKNKANAPMKIDVRLYNQGGERLNANQAETSFSGDTMILSIVMDGIDRNKNGMRDLIRGVR